MVTTSNGQDFSIKREVLSTGGFQPKYGNGPCGDSQGAMSAREIEECDQESYPECPIKKCFDKSKRQTLPRSKRRCDRRVCNDPKCRRICKLDSLASTSKSSEQAKRGSKLRNSECTLTRSDVQALDQQVGLDFQAQSANPLKEQIGLTTLFAGNKALKALHALACLRLPSGLLYRFEGMILLVYNITKQTTSEGLFGVVAQWAHGFLSESVCETLYKCVSEITTPETCKEQANTTPDWLDCLRDARSNWALCKSNRAFKQISKLLGMFVTMGLCKESNLTFNIGQYNLYTPEILDKHFNAFDIFDALFETITFFVEGAYLCYQDGSLRPFLLNDRTAMELDTEYARVVSWYKLVANGNLFRFAKMTDQDFERRMNRLAISLHTLSQSLKGPDQKIVLSKYQNILTMQNDFIGHKISSGVRHAPWAFSLFGESSQGKTTCGDQLVDAILTSQGMNTSKSFRCAFNASDKFMSNWTSDKLVMIFDDLANDKSDFVERAPTRALVDVINNQMFYAPKAELEAKGKCFVEPWVVYATTNVKDLDARVYSKCPFSIQRRMISITVKARPELQRNEDGVLCGLDPAKVKALYDGGDSPGIEDLWLLTVERAVKPENLASTGTYAPVVHNGVTLSDVPMSVVIPWAVEAFDAHIKEQTCIIEGMRNRPKRVRKCAHKDCVHLNGFCPYHPDEYFEIEPTPIGEDEIEDDDGFMKKLKRVCKLDKEIWKQWFTTTAAESPDQVKPDDVENLLIKVDEDDPEDDDISEVENDYTRWKREALDIIWGDPEDEEYESIDTASMPSLDEQFGLNQTITAIKKASKYAGYTYDSLDRLHDRADTLVAEEIYKRSASFFRDFEWIQLIPAPYLQRDDAPGWIAWFYRNDIEKNYAGMVTRKWWHCAFANIIMLTLTAGYCRISLSIFFWYWFRITFLFSVLTVQVTLSSIKDLYVKAEDDFVNDMIARNLNVHPIFKEYRDIYKNQILAAIAGGGLLYSTITFYREYVRDFAVENQGSLEPESLIEVEKRDAERNVWSSVVRRELPITDFSKRVSVDHMDNIIQKSLVHGVIQHPQGNGIMNCLFITSNVLLVPNHYFTYFGDTIDCIFHKSNPTSSGGRFRISLSLDLSYHIPNTDLRLCYTPSGGTYKSLIDFFPLAEMPSVPFRIHWRQKDGSFVQGKGVTVPGEARTSGVHLDGSPRPDTIFRGGYYNRLSINTFGGLCGATLVSETNGSVIVGVHLGGKEGTGVGCYGTLCQEQIRQGVSELRKLQGVLITGSSSDFQPVVLGVQVMRPDALHPKSPLNFMPTDSQIEYYGSCIGRSVTKTSVVTTPISKIVEDVCGEPNIYHGPKLNPEWFGWQACLANMANPAKPFPYALLSLAICDYKEPLEALIRDKKFKWHEARPLTNDENLCGIPGCRFIDAIKLSTAIGFPLTGPKRKRVAEVIPTEEDPRSRILDPELIAEIERVEKLYSQGLRAFLIAKACKKDEVVSGDKCRIFFSNPLALTFLIRKYFLPIMRILQMNPLLAECAVGINSHGPEWEKLHQFILKYGIERLFGGDYGKYDQKLPSQLILASIRILIDLARLCNYSEKDLTIMEAMAGDIAYAYIAFNGDLIGITEGTHISGNSLTVIVNGICGALNLRCYFYSLYPASSFESRKAFRDYISLTTYGDDNMGSVHKNVPLFTIKGCSQFLKSYGQIYTMPDKTSELQDHLDPSDLEFLKRKSVFHDRLGVHVGALLDKSIFKSLHCFMREKNSPLTPQEASAQNIDGALREWFNHGEIIYEERRLQMQKIAGLAGISHMCAELDRSYDDRVSLWFATYYPKIDVTLET